MTSSERRKQVQNGTKSAAVLGNMKRDWWGRTPLLVLALIAFLAGNAQCQTDEEESPDEVTPEALDQINEGSDYDGDVVPTSNDMTTPSSLSSQTTLVEGHGSGDDITEESMEEESTNISSDGLNPIIILVPVILAVVIIIFIVAGIMIYRRLNGKISDSENGKQDPYLDDHSSEKVPMPMFEEDVPSVLELEMEDLEQWMNKDGGAGVNSGPM
ncbi:transmembrane protein 154 [Hypomesus transpacificus]|uniref:transmembrane protein 154 n=1 Tax=Hypomesus transpacificus TaxID=137520 RepID=UPI001F08633D|nr:transmembrane protein 154 [Hypomesus transpacificus]